LKNVSVKTTKFQKNKGCFASKTDGKTPFEPPKTGEKEWGEKGKTSVKMTKGKTQE